MIGIKKDIYYLIEGKLPLYPGSQKLKAMEAVLFDVMGQDFMEEYQMLLYEEDNQSRMDLFRYSLALGASLTGLQE